MHDVRYALRVLRKHRGYAALVVITLALGLGAVTMMVSVADATYLGKLPVPEGDRVAVLLDEQPHSPAVSSLSWPELYDLRGQARSLAAVAGEYTKSVTYLGEGEPERVVAGFVSEDYLRVFGLEPVVGRGFRPDEHVKGAAPVVLLGNGFWQRAFAADPKIVGRIIRVDGAVHTVIGVLPPEILERTRGRRDLLIPTVPILTEAERGEHYMRAFARLAPGATFASARAELDVLGPKLDVSGNGHRPGIQPLRDALYGSARGSFLILLGAAAFLLVIACANVSSIMLARMQSRSLELGVRAALGASRGQLMRHFLVESLLLALAGGVLGVLFALWGKDFLLALWPAGTPRPASVPLSWATVFAASAVAALVGVVVGAVPAWRGASVGMAETLRVVAVPRAGRLRAGLAIVQHAVAILVLVGAALLGKSLLKLVAVNPGFDPANVVTVDVSLPDQRYPDDVSRRAFFEAVIDRMAAQPGVLQASAVSNLPFGNSFSSGSFEIEGRPPFPNDDKPSTGKMLVDGDFFKTMRIPVLEGRPFARGEHRLELMINKTFADRFFPEGAIGQRIDTWGGFGDVVGVVADVHRQGLDDPPELQAYVNFQRTLPWVTFVVRVTGDPARSFSALKSQVYAVDPQLAVASVGTMDDHIAQSAASRRVVATMVAAFAVVALVLAALGIYGVLAYSVSQRTREIGVRMALGARSTTVLALILGQGMRLALAGTIIGLGAALGLARTFDAFLFGVSATDPLIYGGVALLLLGVGLVACLVPALRAASVDPMSALRAD